jgi:hypothetical protein
MVMYLSILTCDSASSSSDQRHVPEDRNLHLHRRESFRSLFLLSKS